MVFTLIITTMFCLHTTAKADESKVIVGNYEYAITPDDSEWSELGSVEAKIEACRIPEEILKSMTAEQLLQAVLDFPFIYDIFAYDSLADGVEQLAEISDAYAELLSRDNAKTVSMNMVTQKNALRTFNISAEEEINNDILAAVTLFQSDYQTDFSLSDIEALDELLTLVNLEIVDDVLEIRASSTTTKIYTPNGTVISYLTYECKHSSSTYHSALDSQAASTYGVTILRTGSCQYNCHSYAWYKQSSDNQYWITIPTVFMNDGSYSKIISGNIIGTASSSVKSGDIVFYGSTSTPSSAHSAIVTSSASGEPLSTRKVKSKWGTLGVFSHTVANVPPAYNKSTLSVWRK